MASLRADIALHDLPSQLSLAEDGTLSLTPTAFKKLAQSTKPVTPMGSGLHHTKRIGCPAMFVGDLVPLSSSVLAEAVVSAQSILRSRRISDVVLRRVLGIGAY